MDLAYSLVAGTVDDVVIGLRREILSVVGSTASVSRHIDLGICLT